MLLPIYFTVCHRMFPFFAGAVIPAIAGAPMWVLAAFWALAVLTWRWSSPRLRLAVARRCAAGCTVRLGCWRWWPRAKPIPPLLRVLFLGFAWLPLAFALYAAQSLWFAPTGEFVLGRAPAHALFIGFFGSLLVAMVTRVTQGHWVGRSSSDVSPLRRSS